MNISVIIPVYKVERYVERCILSIINQTYTEGVECIIVNDCTPDRSMEIVRNVVNEYSGPIHFRLLDHEYNRGLAAVRNTGIEAANGDYIIHIDSDDYCELDMLEKMYGKACQEDADIVVADYWEEYKDKKVYQQQKVSPSNIECVRNMLTGTLAASNSNKIVSRALLIDHKIKYIEGINYGEDYLVSLQLFYYASKVTHVALPFLNYIRTNENSFTFLLSKKSLEDIIRGEKIIIDFFKQKGIEVDFQSELLGMRLFNWHTLLSRSKGNLQKEWNAKYNDITLGITFRYSSALPFYWRIGLLFVACKMLPIYNLIRNSLLLIKRWKGCKVVIYGDK